MKRLIAAVLLLLMTAGFCITTIFWQKTQTEDLLRQIAVLEEDFNAEAPERSLPAARQLIEDFEERTALYPLFLRHNIITEAETELLSLPALLKDGEPLDVPAALVRCRSKLQALYEAELPLWKNIF